jgi:RNA polymerase sigma factor for flagellar operon FliA
MFTDAATYTDAATSGLSEREQMICKHSTLVRFVVRKMLLDGHNIAADFEDLVGHGTIGLIQAIDRFDDSLGIPFPAFAIPRIRGAVLDALRGLDPLSRGQRFMAKQIAASQNDLAMALGREPTDRELRDATGLTHAQFDTARSMAGFACVPITQHSDDGELADGYPEPADPDDSLTMGIERQELFAILEQAVRTLPERERILVGLYYADNLKYREIATVLDISESRVAQLMQQALRRLRRHPALAQAAA